MRILCITLPFCKNFISGKGEPDGMPGFYKFVREVETRGHELHVIFRTNQPVISQLSDRVFFYSGNIAERWRARLRRKFLLDVIGAVVLGWRLGRQIQFDVIYGQQSHGTLSAFILGKLLGVPNVTRLYGSLLYGQYGPNRWRMLRGNLKATLPFVLPSRYLVISQDGTQADRVARLFGVKDDRLRVWFNGVDRDLFNQAEDDAIDWPVPEGAESLLWLGRLQGWKRPDRAIEALHSLVSSRQDVHLVFVGDGDWVPELVSRVGELGLDKHVHFTGAVPHRQVASFYRRCDIFLSLFDYSNLSNTVIEAMACGCCVVALNEGDTSLLIRDGETGFLVDKASLESVPSLLNRLLDDDGLRTEVGSRAQEFVQEHLPSWDERIAMEIALLESLATA
jgi:glycosyltransferase involved in cell wall biosynthesis